MDQGLREEVTQAVKALTIIQPYATLISIGAKKIETRSWPTKYRGDLAIHAGAGKPAWAREITNTQPFREVLIGVPRPFGVIVATCTLWNVLPVEALRNLSPEERTFGDYSPGRFAWILTDVTALDKPVFVKGALGLWEWDEVAA